MDNCKAPRWTRLSIPYITLNDRRWAGATQIAADLKAQQRSGIGGNSEKKRGNDARRKIKCQEGAQSYDTFFSVFYR